MTDAPRLTEGERDKVADAFWEGQQNADPEGFLILAVETILADRAGREGAAGGDDCASCGEGDPTNECPKSKRPCGHHCNHIWENDFCDWCRKGLDAPAPAVPDADLAVKVRELADEIDGDLHRAVRSRYDTPAHHRAKKTADRFRALVGDQ